ncbi:TonB-dependent receptor plug domain-containing protein [Methyloversatilis sp.]|uniref:TonB-dependent receptor plug domain-containing protein n=1 Tax=Methyloversatilis sp. TaxID=2569862 RepID=UPI003D2AEF36
MSAQPKGRYARRHLALCLFPLALAMPDARAQDEPESPFLDDDLPVVLSMTRMPQRIDDAPGAVTLFTREDIERLGYRRLPQLLRLVPGMNVMSDTGHSPALFYHGLGTLNPNRMQVLIDGRSVYSPYLYGYVDWDALPLTMDEIERIEVVRGSNAATYGSNAVAGVVNIVTRSSIDGPAATVSVTGGSPELADASARFRRSFGPLSIALSARTGGDDGFAHRYDSSRLNASTLRADLALDGSDEINFMAGQSSGTRGVGYPLGVPGNLDNGNGFRTIQTDNWFAHVRFRRLVATDNEWSIGYYHNEDQGREAWSADVAPVINQELADLGLPFAVGPLSVPIDYNRTATRRNLDFQHMFSAGSEVRVAWGAELRHEELKSQRMFYDTGRASTNLFRLSANVEWKPSDLWTFNIGNMVESFRSYATKVSPRLFATFHVTPEHAVRGGFSRAYRQPSLIEARGDSRFIYPEIASALTALDPVFGPMLAAGFKQGRATRTFVGTPSLQPERLDSLELGYVGQFGRSSLEVRAFRERYSQLVTEARYSDPDYLNTGITFVPGADVDIDGFEYQYRYRGDGREIWFSHALPRIASNATCRPRRTCYENTVPSSSWSLTWMEVLPQDWSVSATLFGVNSARWFNGSERIDAYQTLDARIAKKFRSGPTTWEAALAVTDIGPRYETFNDDQGARVPFNRVARQTMLTLRSSWF